VTFLEQHLAERHPRTVPFEDTGSDRLKDILAKAKSDAANAQNAATDAGIAKRSAVESAIADVREAFLPQLESAREAWKGDVSIEITDTRGKEIDEYENAGHRWPVFTVTFKRDARSKTYVFQTSGSAYFDILTASPDKYLKLSAYRPEDVTDAVVEEFLNIAVRETLGLPHPGH
jgi:hypothetical protein